MFEGIPDDVVELVSHGNAEHVFDWTMADESLLTSPDVSSWRASLDEDPFAAMVLRHHVNGVESAVVEVKSGNTCTGDGEHGLADRGVRRPRRI